MKNFKVRKGPNRAYIYKNFIRKKFNDHLISIFTTFSNAYTHTNKLRHIIMHISYLIRDAHRSFEFLKRDYWAK